MSPPLAHALDDVCEKTRAVMLPSAARGCHTKWNASALPQISEPPPVTLHVLPCRSWAPSGVAAPMSAQLQAVGQENPGGGYSVAATDTESRVTAEPTPWLWDVTANPASK